VHTFTTYPERDDYTSAYDACAAKVNKKRKDLLIGGVGTGASNYFALLVDYYAPDRINEALPDLRGAYKDEVKVRCYSYPTAVQLPVSASADLSATSRYAHIGDQSDRCLYEYTRGDKAKYAAAMTFDGAGFLHPPPPASPSPPPSPPRAPFPGYLIQDGDSDVFECVTDPTATRASDGKPIAAQCCDGPTCKRQLTTENEYCIAGLYDRNRQQVPIETTWYDAERICLEKGFTLCDKNCADEGCFYNEIWVWTNLPCPSPPFPSPPLPSPPPSRPPCNSHTWREKCQMGTTEALCSDLTLFEPGCKYTGGTGCICAEAYCEQCAPNVM